MQDQAKHGEVLGWRDVLGVLGNCAVVVALYYPPLSATTTACTTRAGPLRVSTQCSLSWRGDWARCSWRLFLAVVMGNGLQC